MKTKFLSHLFNVSSHEWPRVLYSFGLEFFLVVAHTFGHAILIAVTAEYFGAGALPFLWICAAVFTMIATAFYTPLGERFEKKTLVTWLGILSSLFLVGAFWALSAGAHPLVFLGLALFGMSALGAVLHTTVGMLVEGMFSPLEAERVFPLISSSLLIGGAVGGGVITVLTGHHFHWGVSELALIWAAAVFCVVLVNFIYSFFSVNAPRFHDTDTETKQIWQELREATSQLLETKFVRNLAIVVLIEFMLVQLLEFQYATALAADSHHGDGHLIHGLGFYGAMFSVVGLFVQLLFSRQAIHRVGIVRTMLLNPLLTLVPLSALAVKFGAPTAIASKMVYQASDVVGRNAYLASFYVIPEVVRCKVKPLIDGWVTPLGAVLGTLLLIGLEMIFHTHHGEVPAQMTLAVSVLLIGLTALLALRLWGLRDDYTQLSVKNLRASELEEKHTAIEILSQKGHKNGVLHLVKALGFHKKDGGIKTKILEVLGYSQDTETVPAILDHLADDDFEVRYQAVSALNRFKNVGEHFYEQAFARYRISHALEELFTKEKSHRLKQEIIKTFAHLNQVEIVPFLLGVLEKEKDAQLLSDTIAVIASFHDPNIAHYLKHFLQHENPFVRANAIIALWQFPRYRLDLLAPQVKMMAAPDQDSVLATIWMLGEIKNTAEVPRLRKFLENSNDEIRWWAALALAKMGERISEEHLLEVLIHPDKKLSSKFGRHVKKAHPRVHRRLQRTFKHELARRISEIFARCEHDFQKLSAADFDELTRLYELSGAHTEIERLHKMRAK